MEAVSKSEVLLDTNAIFNYKNIVNQGVIDLTNEEPVISQTVADELNEVVGRGGLNRPGIANSLRIVADAASDETQNAVLKALESFGPAKVQGQAQDLMIAATALDTSRPLVTGDQMMFNAIKLINPDFDVRLFP